MVDTDDTRRTTDDGRRTTDDGRRTTPRVWHKLPTGELKRGLGIIILFKTCPVNLISILDLLYCTNYVSKKGVLINNTDHIINTTFIK